ncbi:ABC transporter ATP-binding protein [Polynucleobacter paneuropaeus]|uniref:ABC transporter ATP-binding protein n=1 Tax=Polynucleobacter paneuropaeus TaxID=2527775 RepID=UPI001BFE0C0E|nr:ABC transporter ATP-binding protein [Polynucleobacter paneuropaeus]QWD49717.1 ABC transporter ATP-binding protein [Polynucleobacter paneuropaeus]
MSSSILVKDLAIQFRVYHNRAPSLKEGFANFLKPNAVSQYEDFFAIKNLTLKIVSGERVGIIGANGAGKSTLLKVLCRIYEPQKGSLIINGKIAPLIEIGAGFHPDFTGRENLFLNGAILGYSKKELLRIEKEIISFAELQNFIDTPVKYYSTGMHLRLGFAIATAVNPDILVLDEMFAGGDSSFIKKATDRMHQLISSANIMVMVSHQLELVESLCTRVVWIDKGEIIADGYPGKIISSYLTSKR